MANSHTKPIEHNAFEIAVSLGKNQRQGMPHPNLGPTHHTHTALTTIGRGPRGHVTLGQECRIIAPITTQKALPTLVQDVTNAPVDMIEWRVDLYEPFHEATTPSQRVHALRKGITTLLETSPVPVLATIRTNEEGGKAHLTPEEYAQLLIHLAPADAVDIQAYAPLNTGQAGELIDTLHTHGTTIIASHHNFHTTETTDEILTRLHTMKTLGADIAKVAYAVADPTAALAVMNAQMKARTLLRIPTIAIGMGPAGALTRIGGNAIASAATFATIKDASAPGQFSAHAVREALDLIEN